MADLVINIIVLICARRSLESTVSGVKVMSKWQERKCAARSCCMQAIGFGWSSECGGGASYTEFPDVGAAYVMPARAKRPF